MKGRKKMTYINLMKKYGVKSGAVGMGQLSDEEKKLYSDPRVEAEWQKLLKDHKLNESKLTRREFLKLSLEFSARLYLKGNK